MFFQCLTSVVDSGPTFKRHLAKVWCFAGLSVYRNEHLWQRMKCEWSSSELKSNAGPWKKLVIL